MAARRSKKLRPRREDKMDKVEGHLEENVFDRHSMLTLARFQKKGIFETIDYCIAKGKEANVYRATTEDGKFVAVKIYRLLSPAFTHMKNYIEGDRRFSKGKRGHFGTIYTWTQKEFQNLYLMNEMGLHVPKPIGFKNNVLGMEFLGVEGVPYSTLADVGSEDPNTDYRTILADVKKMHKGGLVHGDLSEFNILMTDKGPYIIDCGQAVLTNHPRAEEFYERDLRNLLHYFKKYPEFKED